jgi:hypothetical protein
MSTNQLQTLREAIARGDAGPLRALVDQLPAEALPEARKLAEQIADQATAAEIIRAIDDRADIFGVALTA